MSNAKTETNLDICFNSQKNALCTGQNDVVGPVELILYKFSSKLNIYSVITQLLKSDLLSG